MHEASLIRDLMRRIDGVVAEAGATRVTRVSIWLGALSHMSASHFRDHFEQAALGGPAEGAALEVDVSEDVADPNAQSLLLRSVEVDT